MATVEARKSSAPAPASSSVRVLELEAQRHGDVEAGTGEDGDGDEDGQACKEAAVTKKAAIKKVAAKKTGAETAASNPKRDTSTDPRSAIARVAVSSRLGAIVKRFDVSVVLRSVCQDNQTSMDGEHTGAFTEQRLKVWDAGRYGGHDALCHSRIRALMPATRSPNLCTFGAAGAFLAQLSFTV